jgi:hypothetical protein
VLIEAAKLGPRECHELAEVRARELERGNRNRATLAVARKMVCYLRCRSQESGLRACREVQPNGSGLKAFPTKEKTNNITIYRRAGCQVPPMPTGRRNKFQRPITSCFGTGREHKLNHL